MDTQLETWKEIKGFEGIYEISTHGRVKSFIGKTKILKQTKTNGYCFVGLSKNKERKQKFVHRLVAIAFIPNPKNKPEVNHKDCVRHNCRTENLEWSTPSENIKHGYKIGKINFRGTKSPNSKLVESDIPLIKSWLSKGWTQRRIAVLFKVSPATISAVSIGRNWSHV